MSESPKLFLDFPSQAAGEILKGGITPYLVLRPNLEKRPYITLDLSDIVDGKHDEQITRLAKGAAEFGQKHGGFFVTTMEEMNGYWYPWGQHSSFIPAWRHIWQIFEDQGANQYATWVWEAFCLEPSARFDLHKMHNPEKYYPGDKYVDWIGFSAFSRNRSHGAGMCYEDLISKSYPEMRTNHPHKAIMQAETAKTRGYDQSRWLIDAYRTIKEMSGLKAVIYYDNVTMISDPVDDHILSEDSLQIMKEIFRDPYWIMARDV